MKIAVEGCCHGELDKIYETVTQLEMQNGFKIDLLIICGDFQSVRNMDDLQAMAVPPKFQKLNTFYKYYSGEKVAPVLTVFIGGNHEASNYLQELPYGGWVARNIYYLGYAGVIQVGGVRIGGISGIYKGHDFNKGHFERPPFDEGSKRSAYHVRNLEVFRLKQLTRHVDIFVSHDWPTGIYHHGDVSALIRAKPFFKKEVEESTLGSKACADLLTYLKPSYWFAAHLHVKFSALVQHAGDSAEDKLTKFLALDKCLPRRKFLQVLDVPHNAEEGLKLKLDLEWLSILQSTNHLLTTSPHNRFMPGPGGRERYDFTVSDGDMEKIQELFRGDMTLPDNFVATAPAFTGNPHNTRRHRPNPLFVRVNPQTTLLCTMLEITDPNATFLGKTSEEILNESNIGLPQNVDDDEDDDDCVDSHGDNIDDDTMNESSRSNTTFNPSFINSSLDISQASSTSTSFSSNISASWDSLTPGGDKKKKLKNNNESVTSTPSLSRRDTEDIQVADDDDELLSILSAQKNKSLSLSLPPPRYSNESGDSDNKPSSSSSLSPCPSNLTSSPPLSSLSILSSSTPLQRSSTAPASFPHPKSSSTPSTKSSEDAAGTPSEINGNRSVNAISKPKKLSVADRLKALNAKETQYTQQSQSANGNDGVTTSADSSLPCARLKSSLGDSSVDSCGDSNSNNNNSQNAMLSSLKRSDTLDCKGAETRSELEAVCCSSSSDVVISNKQSMNKTESSVSTELPSSSFSSGVVNSSMHANAKTSSLSSSSLITESSGVSSSVTSSTSLSMLSESSPPLKRDSSDCDEGSAVNSSLSSSGGGSAKKFKRRNVSVYQEAQD